VAILAVVVLAAALPVAAQQVYRYKDDRGRWVYTDRPPEGRRSAQTLSVAAAAA